MSTLDIPFCLISLNISGASPTSPPSVIVDTLGIRCSAERNTAVTQYDDNNYEGDAAFLSILHSTIVPLRNCKICLFLNCEPIPHCTIISMKYAFHRMAIICYQYI